MKNFLLLFCLFFSFCFCDEYDEYVKQDKRSRLKYKEFSNQIAKTYHLPLECGDGLGTLVEDQKTVWCSKYIVNGHKLTIEEMRPIILNAVHFLWLKVTDEKSFSRYLQCQAFIKKVPSIPLTINYFGMRVDLWDERNNRYLYPYLSQVLLKGGKIHYYYADPDTQALQKPGIVEDLPSWVLGE